MDANNSLTGRVEVGDVVQIEPGLPTFGGSFMIVTEVKDWGVKGYITIPGEEGVAYLRAEFGGFVRIGKAEWVMPP